MKLHTVSTTKSGSAFYKTHEYFKEIGASLHVSKCIQVFPNGKFLTIPPLELVNVNPPKIHPSYLKELKARCHSSPFTKAFIVELKVMMSSFEPLPLDDFCKKKREKN